MDNFGHVLGISRLMWDQGRKCYSLRYSANSSPPSSCAFPCFTELPFLSWGVIFPRAREGRGAGGSRSKERGFCGTAILRLELVPQRGGGCFFIHLNRVISWFDMAGFPKNIKVTGVPQC